MSRIRLAHELWRAAALPGARRFRRALRDPEAAQWALLRGYLRRNAGTAFGRRHGFGSIRSVEAYRERVPLTDYEGLQPFIERIRQGERGVLVAEPVSRLVPSGGSSGGRKLIPWTAGHAAEVRRAIAAWVHDLFSRHPSLRGGPAYWSVSPALPEEAGSESALPIGFEEDAAYLGGPLRWVVRRTLAVPESLRRVREIESSRYLTVLGLLRRADLRLVSVWHPSFLALLLEAMERHWERLLLDISSGALSPPGEVPAALARSLRGWRRPDPARARELAAAGPAARARIWPHLALVSCWADGPAAGAAGELRRLLPGVTIQPKGLMATEGVVSLPLGVGAPLAVASHFIELLDGSGRACGVTEAGEGETYGVALTTGGGLYRYRLGDLVRVEGRAGRTPCVRFVGREDQVMDLRGEKLAAGFVGRVLDALFEGRPPAFAMLAPDRRGAAPSYTLYVEGAAELAPDLAERLDAALSANPHYRYCRRLGQLGPASVFRVTRGGNEAYLERERSRGRRLGEIKPAALSPRDDWTRHLVGRYADAGGAVRANDVA